LVAALLLAACSGSSAGNDEITVFAATSLTESFREIGAAFERAHPEITVRFNFGPSNGLATQIAEGAPADVFASASARSMDMVSENPGMIDRTIFARNRLVIVVPTGSRNDVNEIADLARPGIKLVLAAEGVPAGQYAREALSKAGILKATLRTIVSNEEDVKSVVQRIVLDEADAGIVYATDLTSAIRDRVRAIAIPGRFNIAAAYPVAVARGSPHIPASRRFVAFVLGPGQDVLRRFGFLPA
jgi:molybdate transport system substrate-binding protein